MRAFPSATRRHAVAVVVLAGLTTTGLALPLAQADPDGGSGGGLEGQRRHVQGQIRDAQGDLDDASQEVSRTTAAVDRAMSRLSAARDHLRDVRGDLRDARELDRQRQRDLDDALQRLEGARDDLVDGRAALDDQRGVVRETLVSLYTRGDPRLSALSAYLDAGSMEELLLRDAAADAVVGGENQTFDQLEVVEQQLADREDAVEQAKDDVAARRREAARQLADTQDLYDQTSDAAHRVLTLTERARGAERRARQSRRHDRAVLAALEKREERIKQEILAQTGGGSYSGDTGGFLTMPANGPVTSPFGYRIHPIYHYYGLHDGTDFGAACGSPVVAGAAGRVVNEYYDEVYGNRLYLYVGTVNGANLTLVYNHLSGYAVGEGAAVSRGQTLGSVGTTGWSTGCHLHFTVLRDGTPVDPMGYL